MAHFADNKVPREGQELARYKPRAVLQLHRQGMVFHHCRQYNSYIHLDNRTQSPSISVALPARWRRKACKLCGGWLSSTRMHCKAARVEPTAILRMRRLTVHPLFDVFRCNSEISVQDKQIWIPDHWSSQPSNRTIGTNMTAHSNRL